jgi:hypothetical protein
MKANESKPPMKGRKTVKTMSKPGYRYGPGSSAGQVLCRTGATSGLKAARAWIRLRYGTLEPVVSRKWERHKRKPREAESTEGGGRGSPRRGTGTERPVVVAIGRNGPGRQVGTLVKVSPCGAKGSCHRVLVQRVNHGNAVEGTYGSEQTVLYFEVGGP